MADVRLVDARWACVFVERLRKDKISLEPILREAGLTRRQVSDSDAQIPYHKHAALLARAAQVSDDACFGLRLSRTITPKQAGALGYVLLNSASLEEALRNLVRYQRVLTDGPEVTLEVGDREAALVWQTRDPLVLDDRLVVEFGLGVIYRFLQLITDRALKLKRVELEHARPREAAIIGEIFESPIRYRQDKNALVMAAKDLELSVEAADDELLKILKKHCQTVLGGRAKEIGLVYEVRKAITDRLPSGQPKIDAVAAELGMSSRTLMRELAHLGVTYKSLLDEVRRNLAFRYLQDRRIRLKQIAYLLGYSETAAFYHAFQRWSGLSPAQYRLQSRGPVR